MERYSSKSKGAEQKGNPLRFMNGASKDDRCLADEFVKEVDEVDIFMFMRSEEVALY